MTGPDHRVLRFSDIEVHEAERRVTRAGESLALEPKTYRLLIQLLHNPGHLVTKNELLDAVWGDTAVTESSLTRAVALLRRALEDDPHQPRFIETVATAGYRFICPVEVSEDTHDSVTSTGPANVGDGSPGETLPAKSLDGRNSKFRRAWLVAATVPVVIVAAAIWYLHRPLPPLRVTGYTQITHDGWPKRLVGTDGNSIYFHRWNDPQPIIYAASISTGQIVPIRVGLPGPRLVDVSPDGSTLLVESWNWKEPVSWPSSVWLLQQPGGTLRRILPRDSLPAVLSADGNSVIYDGPEGDIRVIKTDGSGDRQLAPADSKWSKDQPTMWDFAVSPDVGTIRFTLHNKYWGVSSRGTGLHELLPGWQPSLVHCCGRWTPDGRFFIFQTIDPHFRWEKDILAADKLWVIDDRPRLFGKRLDTPIQLGAGPIRWGTPIPSRDGKRIFARGLVLRGELVGLEAQSHRLMPYLKGLSAEFLDFSPDGQSVLYVTFPQGILWRANRDGSSPVQLTNPPVYPKSPRWSPDGSQIVFIDATPDGRSQMYIVSSQGGDPRLLLDSEQSQGYPNWSPDGTKILFTSFPPPAALEEWNLRILDLGIHQVTTIPGSAGMFASAWSPDGRFIAALSRRTRELRIFDLKTQQWSMILKSNCRSPIWSRDSQFLYFIHSDVIKRVRPPGGIPEVVGDISGIRFTGIAAAVTWMGLDPDNTPLLLRDAGDDDIYALNLE